MNPLDASQHASNTGASKPLIPLRVWPAILLVVGLWGLRIIPAFVADVSMPVMMVRFMGPLICAAAILLWWWLLSRASLKEKLIGTVGLAAILALTTLLADKSMLGFGTFVYAVPWGITAFALTLVCLAAWPTQRRTWCALVAAVLGFGYWDLVRTDAIWGDMHVAHNWRWEPTAEDRFLESRSERVAIIGESVPLADDGSLLAPEWSEFRGPRRDGVCNGVIVSEDWEAEPPRELWRVAVGPGWSSFSVAGRRLFTQEQRGEYEAVVCLDADSGAEVWSHQDSARFWEVVGGAGPRATPTLSNGRLFALGASGLLNRLDPASGELIWQSDISKDAGRQPPMWGYASSPLVFGDVVIVHAGGAGDKGLLAYDVESGELRWNAPTGDHSYSSPHYAEICGQPCVAMLTNDGITVVEGDTGRVLVQHASPIEQYRVVQPLIVNNGTQVLLGSPMGSGTQDIEMTWDGDKFASEEIWASRGISPYYNDYVAHQGYLYGFDNNIFTCVDLSTGKRVWKRGRYGNGQVLLLPDNDQLLVISEDGELVLLRATPEKHTELTRFQVLEGRTWNHPVVVNDRLYIRNAEMAACFELPVQLDESRQPDDTVAE